MSANDPQKPRRRLTDIVYVTPFGRYESSEQAEAGTETVLVGRKRQRAMFLDRLHNSTQRGAYLVTGQRGAGKTSFVRRCLDEYKENAGERFLKANVARALFWDRVGLTLIVFACIGAALVASELLQKMIEDAANYDRGALPWLATLPLGLACLYPWLYGRELLQALLRQTSSGRVHPTGSSILSLVVAVGLGCGSLFFVAEPPGLVLRFLVAFTAIYACCSPRRRGETPTLLWTHVGFAVVAVVAILAPRLSPDGFGLPPFSPTDVAYEIAWALLLFGFGTVRLYSRLLPVGSDARAHPIDRLQSPRTGYLGTGLIAFGLGLVTLFASSWPSPTMTFVHLLGVGVIYGFQLAYPAARSKPAVTSGAGVGLLMLTKAVLAMLLGVQLAYPILYSAIGWAVGGTEHLNGIAAALADLLKSMLPSPTSMWRDETELPWMVAVLLTYMLLYYLEYEWIVRPHIDDARRARSLDAGSGTTVGGKGAGPEGAPAAADRVHAQAIAHVAERRVLELTFPWIVFRGWLPLLTVTVNLGFENLDHRRVLQAMLVGLREQYHRAFLAWHSLRGSLARGLWVAILLLVTNLLGERFFEGSDFHVPPTLDESVCGKAGKPPAVRMLCSFGQKRLLGLLYSPLAPGLAVEDWKPSANASTWGLPRAGSNSPRALRNLFPVSTDPASGEAHEYLDPRVYHVLLFSALLLCSAALGRALPIFPYNHTLKRIDDLLAMLSGRSSRDERRARFGVPFLLGDRGSEFSARRFEQEAYDPRTAESLVLQLLDDIQDTALEVPGGPGQRISLPSPELVFVFDELDKLGSRPDLETPAQAATPAVKATFDDPERVRSERLSALLGDMKNLLSAGRARFVFVGGRNLHDEWLADRTSRQPLLTNIFQLEIYLPSLLTDHSERGLPSVVDRSPVVKDGSAHRRSPGLQDHVRAYLALQLQRAEQNYSHAFTQFERPISALWIRQTVSLRFGDHAVKEYDPHLVHVFRATDEGSASGFVPPYDGESSRLAPSASTHLNRHLVDFLTYRSMGNPKRLRELLESFLRRREEMLDRTIAEVDADHVLVFGDIERFRIQLSSSIYRRIAALFEDRLVLRDDKVILAVLFLSDFLLKFHRRAFSWPNLGRVEDLAHIHRAPDLHLLLEELVEDWSDRYLHTISSGLYAYRFRSEVSVEIQFISRQSPEEMAAYNFTLDESQTLKRIYSATLAGMGDSATHDAIAGLGELYEFDQEYERARHYYLQAIRALDRELNRYGGPQAVRAALKSKLEGMDDARRQLTWGVARLRLMLQIGMTFELTRNRERAELEYRNARTLARALLRAMVDADGRAVDADVPDESRQERRHRHSLKHLAVIFQPAFAQAWAAEKLPGSVDTSTTIVEGFLAQVRRMLPFVRDFWTDPEPSASPTNVTHSNYALLIAELHNKAGDLYFFKGRQVPDPTVDGQYWKAWERAPFDGKVRSGSEGYLLRAHYHYALGLHELRRFNVHRRLSSAKKLNIWANGGWEPLEAGAWPDFVLRSGGGYLNDLAEAALGRLSILGAINAAAIAFSGECDPAAPQGARPTESGSPDGEDALRAATNGARVAPASAGQDPDAHREVWAAVSRWLDDAKENPPLNVVIAGKPIALGTLAGWFGKWDPVADRAPAVAPEILPPSSPARDTICPDGPGAPDAPDAPEQTPKPSAAGGRDVNRPEDVPRLLVTFEEGHTDLQRLLVSLYLGCIGGRLLAKGGYLEDAAREYLQVCEVICTFLYWERILLVVARNPPDAWAVRIGKVLPEDGARGLHVCVHDHLVELGVFALEQARKYFERSRYAKIRATQPDCRGAFVCSPNAPVLAPVLACTLGLLAQTERRESVPWTSSRARLGALLEAWLRRDVTDLRACLKGLLVTHSFPLTTRLRGLKAFADVHVLRGEGFLPGDLDPVGAEADTLIALADELEAMRAQLDAPLHFTPLQSGSTFAMVALRLEKLDKPEEAQRFARLAHRDLSASQEMYTLRRSYYQTISGLYYLYDDYNDRRIHMNHALQMAGAEMAALLKESVKPLLARPAGDERKPSA